MVSKLHIGYYIILLSAILSIYSCESDMDISANPVSSKIWVNSIINAQDEVRIYLGTTSGMNSNDIARYRDDATVWVHVNSDIDIELGYKKDDSSLNGYYYRSRLADAKPGDSLSFEAWIENSDFDKIEGYTIIPYPVIIDSLSLITTEEDLIKGTKTLDLKISIDTVDIYKEKKYFELKIINEEYPDNIQKNPSGYEHISVSNNLDLTYGQIWNGKLNSILVDYSNVRGHQLQLSFTINKAVSNKLSVEIKTITEEYFDYFKALDNGSIVKSNIKNGTGIFSGSSSSIKKIRVK